MLGFALGSQEVSAAQANQYLAAVDAASDRVITGERGDVRGRHARSTTRSSGPLGRHADRPRRRSRRPSRRSGTRSTSPADVSAALAATTPAILWVSANVHGDEESGADASLHALYELAARDDCVVDDILANAIVVILPIAEPGRPRDRTSAATSTAST